MSPGVQADGRPATIYDVARAAGVAPSTVSRAFSRPGLVKAQTAERIREVADQLGYRTNPLARALSTARSDMLALVVSDVANPVYSEIIRGSQDAAAESGRSLVLVDAQESGQLERAALERALSAVDGILLAGSRMPHSAIRVISKQKPVVVYNRAVTDVPCVVPDLGSGCRQALEHLAELHHVSVTYLAGPEASWADGMRWRSIMETAAALGMRARRLGPFTPDLRGGERAVVELQKQPDTAVVAYNDQLAIGLMRGLASRGAVVPRDVSVIGFDNITAAELVWPGLTTVAAPLRLAGATATRHLVAMIDGAKPWPGGSVSLPVRLVVRGSTARPGRPSSPAFGSTEDTTSAGPRPQSAPWAQQ